MLPQKINQYKNYVYTELLHKLPVRHIEQVKLVLPKHQGSWTLDKTHVSSITEYYIPNQVMKNF